MPSAQAPEAQRILAREVTQLVHGDEGLSAAMRITEALFSGDAAALGETDLQQLALDGCLRANSIAMICRPR